MSSDKMKIQNKKWKYISIFFFIILYNIFLSINNNYFLRKTNILYQLD